MPRKRSRANTEQRFQDAVLELVAESGCAHLGVNLVAQRAGSDKVLIYRYFGNLEGLLDRVARSRAWLPTANELLASISGPPYQILSGLSKLIIQHIKSDKATHQLSLWRHAVLNPLTEQYTLDWTRLWQELPEKLSQGLGFEEREKWKKACVLLSLTTQAELNGEAVTPELLSSTAEGLEADISAALQEDEGEVEEDILPTNLL